MSDTSRVFLATESSGFVLTGIQQPGFVQIGRGPAEQYVGADVLSALVLAPYCPSVSFSL